MPRGASPKREKEYKELQREFKKEGRYEGREKEVAARIVNKQRSQMGETKEKEKQREGKSPDRKLPIENYEHMTISQISARLNSLSNQQIHKIKNYEAKHKNRRTLIEKLDRKMKEK